MHIDYNGGHDYGSKHSGVIQILLYYHIIMPLKSRHIHMAIDFYVNMCPEVASNNPMPV